MFDIATQLYDARDIRLGPIDYEKDPAVESKWTHDAVFMRLFDVEPARPLSAALVKKQYEKLERKWKTAAICSISPFEHGRMTA